MMSLTPNIVPPEELEGDASDVRTNLDLEFVSVNGEGSENGIENESMPIYVRVRAILPDEVLKGHHECFDVIGDNIVRSVTPVEHEKKHGQEPVQHFTFSQAFGPSLSQSDIFENTMGKSVQHFIEGQNCLIFAYGNSGSGKTYTMHGTLSEPGIIPLTLQLLFDGIKNKQVEKPCLKPMKSCEVMKVDQSIYENDVSMKNSLLALAEQDDQDKTSGTFIGNVAEQTSPLHCLSVLEPSESMIQLCNQSVIMQGTMHYSVWCSFVEIYNEKIYDLLQPLMVKRKRLILGTDSNGNTYVKDAKEISVQSVEEVLKLLAVGKKNLKIASTKLNYQSSRSHSIFTVKLVRMSDQHNPTYVGINLLSFCDLAGSERHCKTQNVGDRLKEAGNINTSLMVLGRCLEALRCNQTQREKKLVVPFRESQLTRLFADFFCGKGRASMIVNISPSSYTFNETLNVLKFSALAKKVWQVNETLSVTSTSTVQSLVNRWPRLSIKGDVSNISVASFQDVSCEDLDVTDTHIREIEDRDKLITELISLANDLEKKYEKEKKEKMEIEEKTRIKLKAAYEEIMDRREKLLSKKLNHYKDLNNINSETRWHQLCQDIKKASTVSDAESEETDEDSDSDNECDNESSSACEKVVSVDRDMPSCSSSSKNNITITKLDTKHSINEEIELENIHHEKITDEFMNFQNALEEKELKENQVNDIVNEKLEELKLQVIKLETALKEKEETLSEKNSEIQQLNCRAASLNEELKDMTMKLNTVEMQLNEEKLKHLQECHAYSEENENLRCLVERLEGIIKIKCEEMSSKEKELQNASTREACKASKIEDLQNTASHLQEKLIASEANVRKAKENEKSYLHEIKEEKVKASKLAEKLNLIEQELDQEKKMCVTLEKKNIHLIANIASLTRKENDEDYGSANFPSSISGASPVTSDKVLALMRQTDIFKRRIEKKQEILGNQPFLELNTETEQATCSSMCSQVIPRRYLVNDLGTDSDTVWKTVLVPRSEGKSLPWVRKFRASLSKGGKLCLEDVLKISQFAEFTHFNSILDLKTRNKKLESRISEASSLLKVKFGNLEKKNSNETADVAVCVNNTVDTTPILEAIEEYKKDLVKHKSSDKNEAIELASTGDGIFNDATNELLHHIKVLHTMSVERIKALLHLNEESYSQMQKLQADLEAHKNMYKEMEEELSYVRNVLSVTEENYQKQIAEMKEDSNAKVRAIISKPVVIIEKLNLEAYSVSGIPRNCVTVPKETPKLPSPVLSIKENHTQELPPEAPTKDHSSACMDDVIILEEDEDMLPPSPIPSQNREKNSKTQVTAVDEVAKSRASNRGRRPRKIPQAKDDIAREKPEEAQKGPGECKTRSGRILRPRKEATEHSLTRVANKRKAHIKETVVQQPTSPLDRVKSFVSGARSRIKAATASYLSPLRVPPAAETPEATPILNKRRKKVLYRPEAEPLLDVPPPSEEKTPACDAKKTQSELIKQINVRRQRR